MPLQDVSNDTSMVGWLRQTGHGHLLDSQHQLSNIAMSSSPPIIPSGYNSVDSYNHSASFSGANIANTQSYSGYHSPTNFVSSPTNFVAPPTQFLAPHMNQQQLDMDIEQMKRDPNTRVIQRPPQDDVVYRQRVFVRYLQPPTPPVGGTIIVREKQPPQPPPDPPLVIRRAPPPPPTPPPITIRERPPPMPLPEATTVINKIVPPPPKPPRQVIIEQYPPLPPKPQDVIIERWLPVPPRQRRILYERLPAPLLHQPTSIRPIVIQHGQPRVRIHREVFTAPGPQLPYQQVSSHMDMNQVLSQFGANQQVSSHMDINQVLSQFGVNQQIQSTFPPSSLISYDPYSSLQQSYGSISHPQSNVIVMQGQQPNVISTSSYGMPLSCVCAPNSNPGLNAYGSGISSIPMMGYSSGQSAVYNVPGNVPVDNVLRQLGVDPYALHQSTDPHSAVSHVWNAASHANPPHSLDPNIAVSHVWNAAAHATDHNHLGSSPVGHNWNNIGNYHPSQSGNTMQSSWNQSPIPSYGGSASFSNIVGGGY